MLLPTAVEKAGTNAVGHFYFYPPTRVSYLEA